MGSNIVVDRCDFQPGSIIDNRYSVKKLLGEGSFGAVYLVEDSQKVKYALKILRLWEVPSDMRGGLILRFKREYRIGQLEPSNIHLVHSLNYSEIGGNPYFLMDFCPEGDLQPYLGNPKGYTSQICYDILSGLHALHQNGFVHRDLKPENVLFREGNIAALTDFGISGDQNERMTTMSIFGKPNQIFGTWAYMPPEQVKRARNDATVLPTTDIFSFGVLVYQILTGQLPFGTLESHNDLAEYIKRGENGQWNRQVLSNVPDGQQWSKLISGCLVPNYKDRIQTVAEVYRLVPQNSSESEDRPSVSSQHEIPSVYSPKVVTHGYQLRMMNGDESGQLFDLTSMLRKGRRVLTVGRQADNSVFIKSVYYEYISRHHATLEASSDGRKWIIRDGQWDTATQQWRFSRNGTYVNSTPVEWEGLFLKAGDIITMGDITLRFENY